jgi:hypothetical protein
VLPVCDEALVHEIRRESGEHGAGNVGFCDFTKVEMDGVIGTPVASRL